MSVGTFAPEWLSGLGLDPAGFFELLGENERERLRHDELVARDRPFVANIEGKNQVIQDVVNHTLCLEHLDRATTFLDRQYATKTLRYMAELWRQPVHLLTNDEDGRETTLTARPNL